MNEELSIIKVENLLLRMFVGLSISVLVYVVLNIFMQINVLSLADPMRSVVQGLCFLVMPLIWFCIVVDFPSSSRSWKNYFATPVGYSKKKLLYGFFEGNFVFLFIMLPCFSYAIWLNPRILGWLENVSAELLLIWSFGVLISITSMELTTKGYVMITLLHAELEKYQVFIIGMLIWILGHIVEYMWLSKYFSPIVTIALIMTGGILSTIVVMRNENVFGVWVGHIALNFILIALYPFFSQ